MANSTTKSISPSTTRLGWIGTGIMGLSMCGHLMTKGYKVTVYNRTKAKAQPLLDKGATWADSPKAVAEESDIIFTMVGFPNDVRDVYFANNGVLAGAKPGRIVIDMTTTEPGLSKEIYTAAKPKGVDAIDAPVSGGDVGARNATLTIMIGGDADAVGRVMLLFEALGKTIAHQGGAGAGQQAKMCNQIVIAGTIIGVCESLLYGAKAGLNLNTLLQSIRGGGAGCWTLDNLAPRILAGNFAPGFIVDHFVKDMEIALAEADRMGLNLPGLKLVRGIYHTLQTQGHGKSGTHALYLALEAMAKNQP